MATTYRQVLNRVLRTLGEDEVPDAASELTDDYHKLVGTFVNQIKEEIEDAHTWRTLSDDMQTVHVAGEASASITSATDRSRLRYMNVQGVGSVAIVYDQTDPNAPYLLREISNAEMAYKQNVTPVTAESPIYFCLSRDANGLDPELVRITYWPTPSTERNVELHMFTPQAYLEDDDLDVTVKVPIRPLILGSIWYALEERGEELGVSNLYTEERYRASLDAAISIDAAQQGLDELVVS
jgi:hypothetical protein